MPRASRLAAPTGICVRSLISVGMTSVKLDRLDQASPLLHKSLCGICRCLGFDGTGCARKRHSQRRRYEYVLSHVASSMGSNGPGSRCRRRSTPQSRPLDDQPMNANTKFVAVRMLSAHPTATWLADRPSVLSAINFSAIASGRGIRK